MTLTFNKPGFPKKDLPIVVLIAMALIATRDFHSFIKKDWRNGRFLHRDDLEIKAHTLKRDMFMHFLRESVFAAWLYLPLINAR